MGGGLSIPCRRADRRFMDKGYAAADIVEQCQRLDRAGIHYSFFYLAGISGAGRGETGSPWAKYRGSAALQMGQMDPVVPQLLLPRGFQDAVQRRGEGFPVLWQGPLKVEGV